MPFQICISSLNRCGGVSLPHRPPPLPPKLGPNLKPSISFPFRSPPFSASLLRMISSAPPPSVDSVSCTSCSSAHPSSTVELESSEIERFLVVANSMVDAASELILTYYRHQRLDILNKADSSLVTIADRGAEEVMAKIVQHNLPNHAVYGEEYGWRCNEESSDFVWVLDPIDGTNSFVTGKPLFGTLIALLYKSRPILGIINQPVLKETWIGVSGRSTTLNGKVISTRECSELSKALLCTTSPHLFGEKEKVAFDRVTNKVKVPLYGGDCYNYALLASGSVDLVVESGLKPYDILPLIPVIEGAGGLITDWKGRPLNWEASPNAPAATFNVVVAGDKRVHQEALDALQWED